MRFIDLLVTYCDAKNDHICHGQGQDCSVVSVRMCDVGSYELIHIRELNRPYIMYEYR